MIRRWGAGVSGQRVPVSRARLRAGARARRPMLPATDAARAEIRRTIARQCLFGVDLNPDGRATRAALAVADDADDRRAAHLSRSSSAHRRQPDRRVLDDLARRRPCMADARTFTGGNGETRGQCSCAGAGARRMDAAMLPLFTEDDTSHSMRSILSARAAHARRRSAGDGARKGTPARLARPRQRVVRDGSRSPICGARRGSGRRPPIPT